MIVLTSNTVIAIITRDLHGARVSTSTRRVQTMTPWDESGAMPVNHHSGPGLWVHVENLSLGLRA